MLKKHGLGLAVLFLFTIVGIKSLFGAGLWSAHDIWHNVARFYHYTQALGDGQLLPAWISNLANGFGYPLFIFSYHLPWLIGAPFVLSGLDLFTTLKILYFLGFLTSGLTMYWYLFEIFKNRTAAIAGASIYLWAPYHFLSIYVSAAIGTVFVFAFLPILFLGIHYLNQKKISSGLTLLSLGVAAIVLSHLMTFVLIVPFLGVWMLVSRDEITDWKPLVYFILGVALGLLVCSYYLLPMFKYLDAIRAHDQGAGFAEVYQNNFVTLKQLLYSPWGYGPIISNAKDGEISFQIGIAQWLGLMLSLVLVGLYKFKVKYPKLLLNLLLLFGLSIFLMIDPSKPLWALANRFVTLDYPFRLIILSVFSGSALVGWSLANLGKNQLKKSYLSFFWNHKLARKLTEFAPLAALFAFLVVAVYTNRNHIRVNMHTDFPLDVYVSAETTTNTFHEYLPKGGQPSYLNEDLPLLVTSSSHSAELKKQNSVELSFEAHLENEGVVSIHQYDFVGQKLYLDGQQTTYTKDENGLISFPLTKGDHQIKVRFEPTPVMIVGSYLSMLGLVMVGAISLIPIIRRKNESKKE